VTEDLRTKLVAEAMESLRDTAQILLTEPYRALCLRAIIGYDKGYGSTRHHHAYVGGLAALLIIMNVGWLLR
jgi:hypothetical protein